ncbi:hypothetical protein ZP71_004666 [Salmonella enterica subsp. enterica]|nr:hypothetical protein [Salmonella enterica subsp. enterica]
MKRMTLLLLAASLLPSCVLAWNTPGEDFSGELKLGGPVTSTRNPWAWKVGEGNTQINTKAVSVLRCGEQVIPVPLPAMTVSSVSGLSRFSDAALRQVDGVYGAQTVADSGELRFKGAVPSRWHTSLAVSIEYR